MNVELIWMECGQFPQSWQVSADGGRMVGHMVLRKSVVEGSSHSSAAILGLKVVGGKLLPDGSRGAIVEKVKKGSIADLEGQLRIGEQLELHLHLYFRCTQLILSK